MMTYRGFLGLSLSMGLMLLSGQGASAAEDRSGPIDSLQDLQDVGKVLFKTADTNNDGMISQKEALDAGNLLVGGFFFRADTNGDGTISKEEATQARELLLTQKPWLRFVIQRAQATKAAEPGQPGQPPQTQPGQPVQASINPLQTIERILDTNNDGQLQAVEVRQVIQTGVQGLFATADTNRDGQLNPTEINAGIIGAVRAGSQVVFQAADDDRNGQISRGEYDKAILEPANTLFAILDGNNDGQLSQQELQTAERVVMSQLKALRVPEPANSARNLLESGRRPEQVAPVPNIGTTTPNQPNPGQPAAPGQPIPAQPATPGVPR